MANKLHTDWVNIKKAIDAQMKKFPGMQKPGKFDQDFGPTLDKLATAYKAKKDDEIKKLATKASGIASAYDQQLRTMVAANHWDAEANPWIKGLKAIHDDLTDLQAHGQSAKNYF